MKLVLIKSLLLGVLVTTADLLANYNVAQNHYRRGDFVAAAGAFYNAIQSGSLADRRKAEWGLAESLNKLEFYYSASRYYSVIVRRGRSASNPFFSQSLEQLGIINAKIPLGQAHVTRLFKGGKVSSGIPASAQGFYHYYAGLDAFFDNKRREAIDHFEKVPNSSPYYNRSRFYMGVVASLNDRSEQAIRFFETVRSNSGSGIQGEFVRELADLNIARAKYERGEYEESLAYYSLIPRDSDNWLQSLFEASWAFFMLQKHNNVLGTIHTIQSPFFIDRFFPETFIIQAITYLRLCKIDKVRQTIQQFTDRYTPTMRGLRSLLNETKSSPRNLHTIVQSYRNGTLDKYKEVWDILDSMSRTDHYKEANDSIRFSDREIARLQSMGGWRASGLQADLLNFLRRKKQVSVVDSGRRMHAQGQEAYDYLKDLQDQTIRINAELLLKNLDQIRQKLNIPVTRKKGDFIGGLQPLKLGQTLEYWPFEGEYWEDELGWYVYNVESQCGGNVREVQKKG